MRQGTDALLLDALREATGRADLAFGDPPVPLVGGFKAEMLRFDIADPPAVLAGDLVARICPDASQGAWESSSRWRPGTRPARRRTRATRGSSSGPWPQPC